MGSKGGPWSESDEAKYGYLFSPVGLLQPERPDIPAAPTEPAEPKSRRRPARPTPNTFTDNYLKRPRMTRELHLAIQDAKRDFCNKWKKYTERLKA